MRRRRIAAAGAGLALLLAGACGGGEGPATGDAGDGVQVEREGEGVTIRAEEQGLEGRFGPDASLPEDFPDDVPVPEGATVVGVMVSERDGTMLSLRSERAADALVAELRDALGEAGWSLDQDARVMGQQLLSGTKAGRTLVVQVMGSDEGARVMIHVQAAAEGGDAG